MNASAQKWLKWALFALCFAILCFMVWRTGVGELYANLCRMRYMMLALVAVWGVGYLLNASSWGLIMSCYPMRQRLPMSRLLQTTITGYAFNYITPMGLLGGEPYRVLVMKRYLGVEAATSSVLLYAIMHFCSHFIFWLLACLVVLVQLLGNPSALSTSVLWALVAVIVICVVLLLLFFRCCKRGMVAATLHKLAHLPLVGRSLSRWNQTHAQQLSTIDAGVQLLLSQHPRKFVASLFIELASRLVCCLEIQLICYQLFDVNMGYLNAYLVVAISSLLANVLFFSPLQMGTRESGIMLALAYVMGGASAETLMVAGISISFATRIREFIWIAIGLLLGMKTKEKTL